MKTAVLARLGGPTHAGRVAAQQVRIDAARARVQGEIDRDTGRYPLRALNLLT